MGTPDFACESLKAIYEANYDIVGVVTNPDKPKGRGMKLQSSPVKEFALEKNIKIFQPIKIRNNEEFENEIKQLKPDIVCVVAYGKILPQSFLDIPKYGCINVHGSLLPKYRGAAPIQRAVLNGDKETGITTMFMDAGMDTGVWAKQKLTGKKNKVWVCGHYDKNGKWIKGHWRKLNSSKPSGGNTANQGNYSDQGSYGDSGSDQSSESPSNGDEGLSGDGNSYEESAETPVAGDDPVLPEIPAEENTESEQSEQATQESGEAEQGKEFSYDTEVSMRTMGMLMDDIVKQSKSINTFFLIT